MHAAKAENFKASSLDIAVVQAGAGMYTVSGKDAPVLHAKLQELPEGARDLIVGDLKEGSFTLKKP
jgi:hypothetical protein